MAMVVVARTRLFDALNDVAKALVEALDADACAVSRVIGDVLLLITEHYTPPAKSVQLGAGYLVSDFPETKRVIAERSSMTTVVGEAGCDPAEERLLLELGYGALLMLPLELRGEVWGLVEVYREQPRPFGPVEVRAAVAILDGLRQ
jgi:GAF domain-containing protein